MKEKTNFVILKALLQYAKQLGFAKEINFEDFVSRNENLSVSLVTSFEERFGFGKEISPNSFDLNSVEQKYKNFASILVNLITSAIVRTNYFLNKEYVSLKINLALFDEEKLGTLPRPLTFREIFVYSENFEAIHLRLGKIARGGIRWSDRKDDFRTEILGLVKTQNTKNTIIVPVGSKGGFILNVDPSKLSKQEYLEFGKKCYREFLCGLLDITDNVIDNKTSQPNIKIFDDKDPYLAVAADKGTASFSDIANSVSKEYNFWLGDAFASGGSNGYDHKKIGITAKGAWISVQRHFLELGVDVQKDEFTVVGIGDMSGDVFGNGMLRSRKIKLIAAFNHMNIFIDPTPDAETSFLERERLFNLPSSTWEDYSRGKLSAGGMIYKRGQYAILTPEIKALFGIKEEKLTCYDLIKVILKSKYDLLWNGGIGTYIKASSESMEEAGDKTNDNLRINGNELGAKVVGEGGNLGFTQKGRIEYATKGGKINTDAIDNSAGVDCSDHEVNIKILLNLMISGGKMTLAERNDIILQMTPEVEKLVLEDNYLQTQELSLEEIKNHETCMIYSEFIDDLEAKGLLDRENEKLFSREEFAARCQNNKMLTRPELSIILAYAKMECYNALIEEKFMKEDPYFEKFLINYFPLYLKEHFIQEIKTHKLKYEIVSTVVANRFVNFAGLTFGFQACKASGKKITEVIKAYFVAELLLNLEGIYGDIKATGNTVKIASQYKTLATIRQKILMPVVLKILKETEKITSVQETYAGFKNQMASFNLSKDDLTLVDI